jgi:hypothetical protein
MALLMMWTLSISVFGAPIWVIHAMGATLTIGRILHAIGLSRSTGPSALRFVGMILTWIAYVIGIIALFWFIFTSGTPAANS